MSVELAAPSVPSRAISTKPADGLLSIVICCHNRARDALECAQTLAVQVETLGGRVFVIDSASNDENRSLLDSADLNGIGVAHIRLDEPGLSLARNHAVLQTHSEWVAFIDDDALPAADWLQAIVKSLEMLPPECGAVGGQILPLYPPGAAPNIGRRWKMYLSLNEQTGTRDCTDKFELIAANCCFRRKALDDVGGFPEGLGRIGDVLLSGEDVMLMTRMRQSGWRIWYDSTFSVGHKIPAIRLTPPWVHARAYWEGITTVRMSRLLGARFSRGKLLKAILAIPVLWFMSIFDEPRHEWRIRYWYDLGVIVEDFGGEPRRFKPKA